MKIKTSLEDGIQTLRIIPETDFVASRIDDLKKYCWEMVDGHPDAAHIVLDACGVDLMDSLGVNFIVGLFRKAEASHKTLEIVRAEKNFMEVACFFRLGSLFPIHAREETGP